MERNGAAEESEGEWWRLKGRVEFGGVKVKCEGVKVKCSGVSWNVVG